MSATVSAVTIENNDNSPVVFPNPAHERIYIQKQDLNYQKMELLDTNGKLMLQSATGDLDISGLPAGIYYIRLTDATQNFVTRIIKI